MLDPLRAALDLILPPRCSACAAILSEELPFCEPCWTSVLPIARGCPRCAEPGPRGECPDCRAWPPPFREVRAGFLYGGQLGVALRRLKYGRAGHLARPLGRLLAPLLPLTPEAIVVPVPLHKARLRRRGYNQAALLAVQALGPQRGQLVARALRRARETPAQAGLDRRQRYENLRGAFRADRQRIAGRPLILVDDVLTTGATARACAEALLEAGAASVVVAVLARTASP